MIVLGIETSCDETAAAIVATTPQGPRILSNQLRAQFVEHAPFGGVVPEIAARAHLDYLDTIIDRALAEANVTLAEIDGVAAATGPGLIGGLIVGTMMAKGIAWGAGKPFIAVNHLEGHALTARLTDDAVDFPYLLLLVSGGHCQLLVCAGVGLYKRLGTTLDDAAGEAFDKTAKLIGLGYPGGPAIERASNQGDACRFVLPRPLKGRPGCDFSFSGLKTAVRRLIADGGLNSGDIADLAAGVQLAICDALIDRTTNAVDWFRCRHPDGTALVAAGGVAANEQLRRRLAAVAEDAGLRFVVPPPSLCTDNAAMIAWVGIERLLLGLVDGLDAALHPRWPLDADAPRQRGADLTKGHK